MHLSTSNSRVLALSGRRPIVLIQRAHVYQLLVVIALTCFAAEAGMWWYTRNFSRYIRQFDMDYNQAAALKHNRGSKSLLIVGNSTLKHGVDVNSLKNTLGSGYDCHALAIEATTYVDWFFALKELFRRGTQPDYVVLVLPAKHVLELLPVLDFSAYYLIGARDIPALARAENLKATEASDVAMEHFSVFYANRSRLRAKVKQHLFPAFESMAIKYMRSSSAAEPPTMGNNPLQDLKALCERNGTTIVFVIPPTNQPDQVGTSKLLELAREARMTAAMPLPDSDLTSSDYSDGFHLNEAGRAVFTASLAGYLREELARHMERTSVAEEQRDLSYVGDRNLWR